MVLNGLLTIVIIPMLIEIFNYYISGGTDVQTLILISGFIFTVIFVVYSISSVLLNLYRVIMYGKYDF